jgi:hypothetical protein
VDKSEQTLTASNIRNPFIMINTGNINEYDNISSFTGKNG